MGKPLLCGCESPSAQIHYHWQGGTDGTLRSLGIQKAFDPSGGDFSKALESSLPIFLDDITEKHRVEVNEYGVIATGYTEINWGYGANAPSDDFVEMVFDRPFLFVIVNEGVPLFVGAVNHP